MVCDCGTPCTFLLPFFVIAALPGLFSYLFFFLLFLCTLSHHALYLKFHLETLNGFKVIERTQIVAM